MDKKTTDIVAYITWIGLLIAILAGDKVNSKFHTNNALVITLMSIAFSIVAVILGFIPFVGWLLAAVLEIVPFACWIIGFIGAIQGKEQPLPIIGDIKIIK